jgi:cytochrome c1
VKGETFPAPSKRESIGPELSAMGQHHSAPFLAEAIVNPSAVIDKGQGYAAPDGSSKMPSFADSMTVQELLDLVAYLKGVRPPAAAKGHHH